MTDEEILRLTDEEILRLPDDLRRIVLQARQEARDIERKVERFQIAVQNFVRRVERDTSNETDR